MRILIVRLSAMGDVIHALPLALNAHMGGASVGWLVDRRYGGLLAGNPCIERLFLADTRRWRREPLSLSVLRELAGLRKALREFAPDITLDPQGLWKSALLARLAGARVVGFSADSRREPSSAVLVGKGIELTRDAVHVVDQNLSLLVSLGIPVTRRAPDARYLLARESPVACAFLRTLPSPFALYHPGAAHAKKTWGESNYAQLASRLHQELGFYPAISWGPGDERRVGRLSDLLPYAARLPRLDFAGLAAVIARSSLFVAGDTGPLHLADALGVRCLALFGRESHRRNVPERNRPYRGTALGYDQTSSVEAVARKAAELLTTAE
jgi:heptosyltransferase I